MKFVINAAVAALVLTFVAPDIAQAQKKDCAKIRGQCAATHAKVTGYRQNDRNPGGTSYGKTTECAKAKGC
jgi:hypothetical protein